MPSVILACLVGIPTTRQVNNIRAYAKTRTHHFRASHRHRVRRPSAHPSFAHTSPRRCVRLQIGGFRPRRAETRRPSTTSAASSMTSHGALRCKRRRRLHRTTGVRSAHGQHSRRALPTGSRPSRPRLRRRSQLAHEAVSHSAQGGTWPGASGAPNRGESARRSRRRRRRRRRHRRRRRRRRRRLRRHRRLRCRRWRREHWPVRAPRRSSSMRASF